MKIFFKQFLRKYEKEALRATLVNRKPLPRKYITRKHEQGSLYTQYYISYLLDYSTYQYCKVYRWTNTQFSS